MNDENQLIQEGNKLRCELQNMRVSRDRWKLCCIASIVTIGMLVIVTIAYFLS